MNELKQTAAAQANGETCAGIAEAIENIQAPEETEKEDGTNES